jgi:Arc/MetJ-type ribon-helix-helix transcriptional regulator
MVRTQIQLTEKQFDALRRLSAQKKKSLADLIRQSVELLLAQESRTGKTSRIQRALAAAGKFSSGGHDGSSEHDRHLADAYRG